MARPVWCTPTEGTPFWLYRKYCSSCQNLKRRYGITYSERAELLEAQSYKCLVCDSNIEFGHSAGKVSNKSAVIDHCHTTNKVRGILCGSCNIMLGKAYDNTSILKRAIDYLESNNEANPN